MTGWKYFYSDEGETVDDARDFSKAEHIVDAEDAARAACARDYYNHDGWERGDRPFVISIVAPDGTVSRFNAYHEPSVEHCVYELD